MTKRYTLVVTDTREALWLCRFPGGAAHHLENRSTSDAVILEVGDRTSGEEIVYPSDNVRAVLEPNGGWRFLHIDGSPL